MKKSVKAIAIFFCVFSFFSCATKVADNSEKKGEKKLKVSTNIWKNTYEANPISPNVFCADPTAVEFEGRLYVYGTNDHQQYFNAEKNKDHKYNPFQIRSINSRLDIRRHHKGYKDNKQIWDPIANRYFQCPIENDIKIEKLRKEM